MPEASSDAAETWAATLVIRLIQGCQRPDVGARPAPCSRISPSLAAVELTVRTRRVRGAARSILHGQPAGTLPRRNRRPALRQICDGMGRTKPHCPMMALMKVYRAIVAQSCAHG